MISIGNLKVFPGKKISGSIPIPHPAIFFADLSSNVLFCDLAWGISIALAYWRIPYPLLATSCLFALYSLGMWQFPWTHLYSTSSWKRASQIKELRAESFSTLPSKTNGLESSFYLFSSPMVLLTFLWVLTHAPSCGFTL